MEELLNPELQNTPSSNTVVEPSPAPPATAMEVDNDFGQFVGELIEEATHGDKSPVGPEIEND